MEKLHSIRYKLLISMSLISLFFVLIVLCIWYGSLKRQAKRTAINNMQTTNNIASTAFENQVQDMINIASLTTIQSDNSLSTNILNIIEHKDTLSPAEIITYRKNANDFLISLCSFKKYLNGLMLCNFKGDSVCYGNSTSYNMLKKNHWIDALPHTFGETAFIAPHYWTEWYANENDLVFSLLKPVFSQDHRQIGFVIADINCQLFHDTYDSLSVNNSLYIINNKTDSVIYASENNKLSKDIASKLPQMLSDKTSAQSGNFMMTIDYDNYLVVYNNSQLTDWDTVSIIPERDILADFTSTAEKIMLITLLILCLMLFFVFEFSSLFTSNIIHLTSAVKSIGENTLDLDVTINSHDEIAELTTQFRAMLLRIQNLITEVHLKEQGKRQAEIAALQFQMNPHFLYNSLNTIKFLASIQGIENIEHVAELLSSLMHTNMDGRMTLSVAADIQFVTSYLELQAYKQTNLFTYDIHAEPEVTDCYIPKLFVQPLVENAIKHGLSDRAIDGNILISYKSEQDALRIIVQDNGKGMSKRKINEILTKNQHANAGHIGIYNLRQRIKLYYGDQYDIHIESVPDAYTKFELILPLIYGDEENAKNPVSR